MSEGDSMEPASKRARLDHNDNDAQSNEIVSPSVAEAPAPQQASATASAPGISSFSELGNETKGLFASLKSSLGVTPCTEPEVGVTQYADPDCPPFSGIIKHRFTDFLVYEVGLDGQVVRLKDIKGPQKNSKQAEAQNRAATTSKTDKASEAKPITWSEAAEAAFSALLDPAKLEEFKQFVTKGSPPNGTPRSAPEYIFESSAITSKEERTAFHAGVRNAFDGRMSSELKDTKDKGQVIQVTWRPYASKTSERMSKEEYFAQRNALPPYIHMSLHKVNKEMHDAISGIARQLKLTSKEIGTAGTKDKRAVTVQKISIKRGNKTVEDVWRQIRNNGGGGRGRGNFRKGGGGGLDRGVRIGDIEYAQTGLDLGMLKGNKFVVTLRDVQADSVATIERAMESLRTRGFINYFGMQRFGSGPIPTHAIGLALMRQDWKLATDFVLKPRTGESEDMAFARQLWVEGKHAEALRNMPRRAIAERPVMELLARNPKDHLSALSRIPKNLRLMYVHAWQSYVWNLVLSERVKMHGCTHPVVGDLVYAEPVEGDAPDEIEASAAGAAAAPVAEPLEPDLDDDAPTPSSGPLNAARAASISRIPKVRSLTQEDIDSGSFTIFDVVLPLPGYAVEYPANELGDRYREIMRDDGLDPDALFRHQKEYSLGGTYRKIMHLPTDVSHRLLLYASPNDDLVQTDEDRLLGRAEPAVEPFDEKVHGWPVGSDGGKHVALQLEITLGSSTYCTMALREVLKVRTSNAHQRMLTEQMEERLKSGVAVDEQAASAAAQEPAATTE